MSKYDNIDIKFINDAELLALFKELVITEQSKIINAGIRKAAKPIIDQAKSNFNERKKNKSLTGYKDLNSSFKVEPLKKVDVIGVKVGVKYVSKTGRNNYYKYRWIEWGTNERFTKAKKKRFTGKMEATHFFYDAVAARKEQAQKEVANAITQQMQTTINKYEKMK